MNHWKFISLAALAPLALSAAPTPPTVSCWLDWDVRDKAGVTLKTDHTKPVKVALGEPKTQELKSFTLEARLSEAGTGGGAPAFGHELAITIKHGDQEAIRVDVTKGANRHALIFIAGRERVVALCDIKQP